MIALGVYQFIANTSALLAPVSYFLNTYFILFGILMMAIDITNATTMMKLFGFFRTNVGRAFWYIFLGGLCLASSQNIFNIIGAIVCGVACWAHFMLGCKDNNAIKED